MMGSGRGRGPGIGGGYHHIGGQAEGSRCVGSTNGWAGCVLVRDVMIERIMNTYLGM